MITVREAVPGDGPALVALLLRTPMRAGTEFVLDRGPEFDALLRLRGSYRTFVACVDGRPVGVATALWHDVRDGATTVPVGEIADLRVAVEMRGTPVAARLLHAVRDALDDAGVAWATCIIGEKNRPAVTLARGGAGLPALEPLTRYASVHYVAWRRPGSGPSGDDVEVRVAAGTHVPALDVLMEESLRGRRFVPPPPLIEPDPTGAHRSWIATDRQGVPVGGLVVWDGQAVRRIRVMRYSSVGRMLCLATRLAARAGIAACLPSPGGVLRVWASRWLGVRRGGQPVVRALVRAALRDAAEEGVHVVQVNLAQLDPARQMLPGYPRYTYWSTLYGRQLDGRSVPASSDGAVYYADLAFV